MERERSRNVHRVSLRHAAATGATAGMERYVKPQPPAPAQSAQPPARSHRRGPPHSPQRRFRYSREPPRQHQEEITPGTGTD